MITHKPDTLIIVPGHGICVRPAAAQHQGSWIGIYPHEEELLYQHCQQGVLKAHSYPDSLLVFSGGATRPQAGEISEAESYQAVAAAEQWWGSRDVALRVCLETLARDSLGNLILSPAVFRNEVGFYPKRTIVYGFAFKRERFYMHAKAIRFPGKLDYVGVNDPPKQDGILDMALRGEKSKLRALKTDPLLQGREWQHQRAQRNPFTHSPPYIPRMPILQRFLDYLYGDGARVEPAWTDEF